MIPHREEIRERLIQDETGFIAELINDETEYKTIKEYNFKTGSKYQDLSTNDKILFHRLIIAELPFIGYDLQQSVKKHRPEIDFRIIEDSVKQTAELNKREIERLELNKEIESREITTQTPESYKPKGKKFISEYPVTVREFLRVQPGSETTAGIMEMRKIIFNHHKPRFKTDKECFYFLTEELRLEGNPEDWKKAKNQRLKKGK